MTTATTTRSHTLPGLNLLDRLTAQFAPLAGRLMIGGMFAMAGYSKIGAYAGTQGYMESVGLPGALLPLVIAFEIGAGLALIAGWQTRIIAFLLSGFTLILRIRFNPSSSSRMWRLPVDCWPLPDWALARFLLTNGVPSNG